MEEYIQGYYCLDEYTTFPKRYLTFPTNYLILTYLHHATVQKDGDRVLIYKTEGASTLSLTYNYTRPMEINYVDKVKELTIYFKPFGLQQFFTDISCFTTEMFYDFNPHETFKNDMAHLLTQTEDIEQQIENYLLMRFQRKEDLLLMELLQQLDQGYAIEDIANNLGISRQYVSKYLKKRIGKNASDYKKIARFRKAIQSFQEQPNQTLTQLTYNHLFFDQSHLIKEFKRFTKHNPKDFFDKTKLDVENVWLTI
ncbi:MULTISPECIES: helix-turn-helix domain-containing protein [unclassified Myroides]|uniref:helix-turn-helix domain-containing protein n=1 Tax=unclassified Myroides TaxID=2642485 RepID=UPI003D2F80DD